MTDVLEESPSHPDLADLGSETEPSRWGSARWGVAGGLTLFVIFIATNVDLIRSRIFEDGDFAANSILIDKAVSGPLLTGHYSRVGFYHPGPALLDTQALGQFIFHTVLHLTPTPFGGQYLGALALNAVCVGVAIAIATRLLGSPPAALALVPVILLVNTWVPYGLESSWMPHVFICPFLLLCVSGAAVASGSWTDLKYLALSAGLTVHGHVSFVMFAGVTVLVSIGFALVMARRARRLEDLDGPLVPRRELIWAGGVSALFAAPIIANLALHWPGQFSKYIKFTTDKTGFLPRSSRTIVHFVREFWMPSGWKLFPVLAIAVLVALFMVRLSACSVSGRRFVLACLAVCALETVLLFVYADRGVDDLSQTYVGYFALSLPVIVLWLGLGSIIEIVRGRLPQPRRALVLVWALVAVAFVPAVVSGTFANPYRGSPSLPRLSNAIGPGPVRLEFTAYGWPVALGLVEERRRQDRPVCVENRVWTIIATAPLICSPHARGEEVSVLGPGDAPPTTGTRLAQSGVTTLVEMTG